MDILTRGEIGTTAPQTFTVRRHHEDGCWWAESEQIPGWSAAASDETELYRLACEAPAAILGWPEGGYNVVLLWAEWPLTYEEEV